MRNLTDFRKTVESAVDPRLVVQCIQQYPVKNI